MTLSQIIAACEAFGEPDPETNVEKVERAKCVADGVVFTEMLSSTEREDLENAIWNAERDQRSAESELADAEDEIARLKGLLTKAGIKF